jgi:hypothetical protein
MQLCFHIIGDIPKVLNYMEMIFQLLGNFMEVTKIQINTNKNENLILVLDPPSELLVPSVTNSEEITSVSDDYTTKELTTASISTSTTVETTTTTTTTTTTSNSPITILTLTNKAQIQGETTTTYLNRTKNRYVTNSTPTKLSRHWLQSYHETRTSTEQIKVNYTDRTKLDLCDGYYDAITMYKGILFIFKGQVSCFGISIIISFIFILVFLAI